MPNKILVANYGLDELLQQVNDSSNPLELLTEILDNKVYAKFWLEQAVNDVWVDADLEEFDSVPSILYHSSLAGAIMMCSSSKSVYEKLLINPNTVKKTKIFQIKNLLEMFSPGESKLFWHILTKNVSSLYPNISFETIYTALHGLENELQGS